MQRTFSETITDTAAATWEWTKRLWHLSLSESPARIALVVFAAAIALFTLLLRLDIATTAPGPASWPNAIFVATSAVCVTGLTPVDTATYWSPFGHVIIAIAIKVGGLGVLTLAGLLILVVSRRLGLRQRIIAANDVGSVQFGDIKRILIIVIIVSVITETIIAAILFPRFLAFGESPGLAAWHAYFYGISSYNNAGFVLHENGLPGDPASDWWLSAPIAIGVLIGSLGTAVHMDIFRKRPKNWTLHTNLTMWMTGLLFVFGAITIYFTEFHRDDHFDHLPTHARILTCLFTSIMPRSGGFTVLPMDKMSEDTWWLMDGLMFVGGGTGSTAGGIKVTTLAVLIIAAWSESVGEPEVVFNRRRIPHATVKIAIAVLLAGASTIWVGTLGLLLMTNLSLTHAVFEVTSAFATVGLSTGVTPYLGDAGKLWISLLMFIGRVGLLTLGAAISLRERTRLVRYPEERPAVG